MTQPIDRTTLVMRAFGRIGAEGEDAKKLLTALHSIEEQPLREAYQEFVASEIGDEAAPSRFRARIVAAAAAAAQVPGRR